MGVYGAMLLAWPEQFRTVTVYDMEPILSGGWQKKNPIVAKGIIQHTTGKKIKDMNGNLVASSGVEFWSETGNLSGKFMNFESMVYRLTGDNMWESEGGFYRYSLEKVIGNDGTESDDTTWNIGTNNFG